jgi:hypothetical protein
MGDQIRIRIERQRLVSLVEVEVEDEVAATKAERLEPLDLRQAGCAPTMTRRAWSGNAERGARGEYTGKGGERLGRVQRVRRCSMCCAHRDMHNQARPTIGGSGGGGCSCSNRARGVDVRLRCRRRKRGGIG